MADRLSSQAGPVNIMYELDESVLRPPIPPKHPHEEEANAGNDVSNGYEGQQQYQQQAANNLNRSPSGYAPQVTELPKNPVSTFAPIPESVVSSPSPISSAHPSMGYGTPSEIISPSDSYHQSYQPNQPPTPTKYAGPEGNYPAPQYNAPITGYYTPVQYNPDQSYGIQQGPYVPQSPPPTKPEFSQYNNQVQVAGPPPAGPTPPGAATAGGEQKKKKRLCGMTVTVFSLLCVALFVVVAGAVLGGVFGSGVLKKKDDPSGATETPITIDFPSTFPTIPIPKPTPSTDPGDKTTTTTPTTTTTTATVNTFAYAIPTGTWTITASLTLTTGSCIDNLSDTDYKEVWYCSENQTQTIVVQDYSTTEKYNFMIDLDEPVRRRGVLGIPPTGPDTDKGESPFWLFQVPYQREAFEGQTGCEVGMSLTFLLGRTQSLAGFYESAYAPNSCVLPHGGNSTARITCGCGYIQKI